MFTLLSSFRLTSPQKQILSNNRNDSEAGEERFTKTLLSVKVNIEKISVIHWKEISVMSVTGSKLQCFTIILSNNRSEIPL
jgi:hypothetical protein